MMTEFGGPMRGRHLGGWPSWSVSRERLGALLAAVVVGVVGMAVAAAPPASAGSVRQADVFGFAFMDNPVPRPGAVLDPTRQWGSWKTAFPSDFATVEHLRPGGYRVRFPHIGVSGGVAHVTAVLGAGPAWCQLARWFAAGGDELVEVQCYHHGGVPEDTRFAIEFAARSNPLTVPGGQFAYAHVAVDGTLADSFTSGDEAVESSGEAGQYLVALPGVGVLHTDNGSGNIQVTATDAVLPRRCAPTGVTGVAHLVLVEITCVDGSGALADSEFTLTYHRERAVFGEVAPPKRFGYVVTGAQLADADVDFNNAGAANMVLPAGAGRSQVLFGRVGTGETNVQVTVRRGGGANYCALGDVWQNIGGDGVVPSVVCFDSTGQPANNAAFVTFSSRL